MFHEEDTTGKYNKENYILKDNIKEDEVIQLHNRDRQELVVVDGQVITSTYKDMIVLQERENIKRSKIIMESSKKKYDLFTEKMKETEKKVKEEQR